MAGSEAGVMGAGADTANPGAGPGWSQALPLVGAAAVQFTVSFLLRDRMEPGDWGLFFLVSLAAIVPVGIVLWLAFFRKRDPRGWWKIVLTLWTAGILGLVNGVAIPGERAPPEHDNLAFALSVSKYWMAGVRIAVATANVAQGPDENSGSQRPAGLASGDMREINRIDAEFNRQMREDGSAYEAALVESGYPDLLLARNLRSPADLPAARQRLERVQALIEQFRARYTARIEAVEDRLGRVALEAARADLVAGFRAVRVPTQGRTDQIWRLERDVAQTQRAMLDLLGATRWRRDGERFVFAAASDQRRFDALAADLNQSRDDQAAWRREILETMAGVSTGAIITN